MPKNIPAAYAALQDILAAVAGVRSAPDYPQESPTTWPYLEMGPIEASWEGLTMGQPNGTHKLPFKIHTARTQGLPKAYEELLPFAERIHDALWYTDKTMGGTVNGIESLTCKLKPDKAGSADTLAWECVLTVRISAGPSGL